MQAFKRPVIPLVLSYMAGIGLGGHLASSYRLPLLVACLSAAHILWRRTRFKSLLLSPLLLLAASGYLSILPWANPQFPGHHIVHQLNAPSVKVIGKVVSRPYQVSGRTKFIFACRWLRNDQSLSRVSGKIRVTLSDDTFRVARGQTLELAGRLRPLKNFQNPGGFDYVRRMAYQQIWASLYTNAGRAQVLGTSDRGAITTWIDRIRVDAARWIDSHADSAPAALLKALLVGDRYQITPELRLQFSRAGVSHILAISGLHIGIVATVAFSLFSWALRQSGYILQRGWYRKLAALLTLVPVVCYGILAGMSPSTQRAVLMAVVFMATFWFERELDIFSSLAAAAGIILIVFPPSLFSISFQLSFTAVFAILFGLNRFRPVRQTDRLTVGTGRILEGARRYLFGMVTVSVFAVWGTLPLTMLYFNQMSFTGVIANLVVVPVIGFCVVPLGLTALCLWPVWESLSGMLIPLTAWILSWMMPVIDTLARLPLASLATWTPTVVELVCFYTLSLCGLMLATRGPDPPLSWRGRIKPRALLWSVLTLSLLVLGADSLYWLNERYWHRDLKITILDVGHGNAALIEFPGGRTFLLDGGGFADIAVFYPGARLVAPYLRRRKILTVDTLLLSHPNSDHMNGLIYIADHFNVKELWTNGEPRGTLGYRMLMNSARIKQIKTPAFETLDRQLSIGGVMVRLLYPPPGFLAKRESERWRNTKNHSLVVQLIYKNHAFLFPGDITRRAEAELVRSCGAQLQSTVLIVPHHGSKTSSSAVLLSTVAPEIAIVSARGRGKRRHPHPSVVERYRKHQCRMFSTEELGAIRLISDGQRLKVEPYVEE